MWRQGMYVASKARSSTAGRAISHTERPTGSSILRLNDLATDNQPTRHEPGLLAGLGVSCSLEDCIPQTTRDVGTTMRAGHAAHVCSSSGLDLPSSGSRPTIILLLGLEAAGYPGHYTQPLRAHPRYAGPGLAASFSLRLWNR